MRDAVRIKLKYVEVNRTKAGTPRYFFRRGGKRHGRIPGEPGSTEFMAAYNLYLEGKTPDQDAQTAPRKRTRARTIAEGTFGHLCRSYVAQSMDFRKCGEVTRTKRIPIIEAMMMEPVTQDKADLRIFGEFPLKHIKTRDLEVLRDRKSQTPHAADERVKVLRQIFKFGMRAGMVSANHARDLEKYNVRSDGHQPATWDDIRKFREFHGEDSMAWLAISILVFTGVRVSDLRQLGRQHRKGDSIRFRMVKGATRRPMDMTIWLHPTLIKILDAVPANRMTYVVTEHGHAFGNAKTMSDRVSKWFKQAGIQNVTAHSARKLLTINLAENGATDEEMNAALGWTGAATSKIYTRKANRAALSRNAMMRILDEETATPQTAQEA